jgi:polar amino acid transport system ATP-binding protein/sulfate transport system ATP-binding protein
MEYGLGQSLLTIKNVSVSYGDKIVLREVSAEVKKIIASSNNGQVIGFLGPSGIGKTTLFRVIAGLLKPTNGQVSIMGKDSAVKAGEVGVLAQSYPLFEHRNVMSNLMLAAKQVNKDEKIAKEKVITFLNEFDLADKTSLYPVELSGGQRQRVAIIQQILCSEHFLLMDEPFSGLDMIMVEKTGALIQKVAKMNDLNTIIICTHDITSAASVSDHLWLMGRDRNPDGSIIPGARIVKEYDLLSRDLCWSTNIITTEAFTSFVREVKDDFRRL